MSLFKKITKSVVALTLAVGMFAAGATKVEAKATYLKDTWREFVTFVIDGKDYKLSDMVFETSTVNLSDVDKTTPVFVKVDLEGIQTTAPKPITDKKVNFKSNIVKYYNGQNYDKYLIQPMNEDGTYSFKCDGKDLTVGDLGRVMQIGIYLDKEWDTSSNFAYIGMDSAKSGYLRVFGEDDYYTNEFTINYVDATTGELVWSAYYVDETTGLFGKTKLFNFADLPMPSGLEYVENPSLTGAYKAYGYTEQSIDLTVNVLETNYTELDKAIEEAKKALADAEGKEDCYDKGLLEEVKSAVAGAELIREEGNIQFVVDEVADTLNQYVEELLASYKAPEVPTEPGEGDKEDPESPDTSDMNIAAYGMLMLAAGLTLVFRKKLSL